MALELFGHPFSSYTWKALIAFYEADTHRAINHIFGTEHRLISRSTMRQFRSPATCKRRA